MTKDISHNIMSELSLVSPYEFCKLSKWRYCPYYGNHLDPELIQENDIVFLNLDYFTQFIHVLSINKPKHKFILIIHNSYRAFNNNHFEIIYNIVNHIYTINSIVIHPSVSCIPIGFVDKKYVSHNLFLEILNKYKDKNKDIFLYSNFILNKNKQSRIECLNAFIGKSWVYKDQNIPFQEYLKKICRSKYILAPEGKTIDTHRIYISLFFNTIPIMKKTVMDYFYVSLPIILVNSWNEVTYDFLEKNYNIFYEKFMEWKQKHDKWNTSEFWIQ